MTGRGLIAGALLAASACTAHVEGALKLDGATFAPTTCASGQGRGFPGIELADARGQRVRIGTNVDGTSAVATFAPASPVGDNLGACANMSVQPGTGVINGVRNLEGTATFACQTDKHRVEGVVRFESCH